MNREMRDSGIMWIGEIPADWRIMRLKYATSALSKGYGITKEDVVVDGDSPCVRYGEIYTRYNHSFSECFTRTNVNKVSSPKYFSHGDVLFCCTGELVEEIGKSIVYLGNEKCLAGGDILVAQHSQDPSFMGYALDSIYAQGQKSYGKAKLKVVHISSLDIANLYIVLPPIPEQPRISAYLDKKCSDIDSAIARQKTLIEKLKEYKKSVITKVATKGLNPDAKMKDSGIDWLGIIPDNWEIGRLKFEFTFSKGLSITKADLTDEGTPVLSYGQVHAKNNSGVALQKELLRYVPQETVNGNSVSCVHKHDFIFADTSEDIDGCGNCVYVDKDTELYGGYHTIVLHSKNKNDHQYLAYLFKIDAWRSQIRKQLTEVKLYSVSQSVLKSTKIVLPPEKEQKEIALFLNRKCADIDSAIVRSENLINKLEEYKKSVIFNAVTGKMDCRNR